MWAATAGKKKPTAGKRMSQETKDYLAGLGKKKKRAGPKRKVPAATLEILAKGRAKRAANLKRAHAGAPEAKMAAHAKHHSQAHMAAMRKAMRAGHSFAQAHAKATKLVGK